MQKSLGYTVKINLSLARMGLGLGPGWAALAGVLAVGFPTLNFQTVAQLVGLWILADPILGTLWDIVVRQQLWRQLAKADLPPPPAHGFLLPYAQPGSVAGRWTLLVRCYRLWLRRTYWPTSGDQLTTALLGSLLALLLGGLLHPSLLWLTALALAFIALAGLRPTSLSATGGGRWQSLVQFLLPFGMGMALFPSASLLPLALGFCYWGVYLGGLRMLGRHPRANWLWALGQIAVVGLLLALNLLPGAALVAVLLLAQLLAKSIQPEPEVLLFKTRGLLLASLLAAALSVGSWWG